jgi:hypothetical protein
MEEKFTTSAALAPLERLVIFVFTGLFLICGLCAAAGIHYGSAGNIALYWRLIVDLFLIGIFLGLMRMTLTKEMVETVFVVFDDAIVKRGPYRIATVPFSEITAFRHVCIPFFRHYGSIRFKGGGIRISFRTTDHYKLICILQVMLERAGKSGVFSENNIARYKRAAYHAESAHQRLARFMPYCLGVTMLTSTVSTITALFLWKLPFFLAFLWSVFGLTLFVSAIIAAETIIAAWSHRAESSVSSGEKAVDETGIYFMAGAVFFIIFLSCGIALKTVCGL